MTNPEATAPAPAYEGWAIVEVMGHRRIARFMREVIVAGAPFVRIDQPADEQHPESTHCCNAGKSIFGFVPATEATARAAARSMRPVPVSTWEIERPALPERVDANEDDQDDNNDETPW